MAALRIADSSDHSAAPVFEDEARAVLNRVRKSFVALLNAVASGSHFNGSPSPTDLQRALGIPATLAWRVHRFALAQSPFREVDAIPGPTAIDRIVRQGKKKGLPEDQLVELRESIKALEKVIHHHAGNRQTFNSMAASLAGESKDLIDATYRKAAFQANGQIWGVQARLLMWTGMYHPGANNQAMQNTIIMGAADVRRLHADCPPHEIRLRFNEKEHNTSPQNGGFGPILLEEFSTQPLPIVNRELAPDGAERLEIRPPTMGTHGATSFFVAEGAGDQPWSLDDPDDRNATSKVRCGTPAEVLVVDVLVYRDMFGVIEPQAGVFDGRSNIIGDVLNHRRLPLRVNAEYLGTGVDAMHMSELPRYSSMVEEVCNRRRWDATRFDVYRCRVKYPVMSSIVAIWFPLPEKGNW